MELSSHEMTVLVVPGHTWEIITQEFQSFTASIYLYQQTKVLRGNRSSFKAAIIATARSDACV